jgi:Flp pilus assembly protein TadG
MIRLRRRDEGGQALVEFALVLPLIVLLMAVAFNGWNGIQLDLRLTSAARAGAIEAANDLAQAVATSGTLPAAVTQAVQIDVTNTINNEENTNIYQYSQAQMPNYVSIAAPQAESVSGGGAIYVVNVTISNVSVTLIPIAGNISVTVHATARYS